MLSNPFSKAVFIKSAATVQQLPPDEGIEVAFAGRSNAGKSSALNCLTNNRHLARTSKTPGRTQLINLFGLDATRRLVDLPGYGYAKVALSIKQEWQKNLADYLETRACLHGIILLMDCRHPLKELDKMMIGWALERERPVHILLTKADKISRSDLNNTIHHVAKHYQVYSEFISVQGFSSQNKNGLPELITQLNRWFAYAT